MAKRNRSTLKNYFRRGAMPSAEHFADLVDSSLNTLEEGFDKTPEQGFKISSLEENASLMSFYRDSDPDARLWSASYHNEIDSLLFNRHLPATLSRDGAQDSPATDQPLLSNAEKERGRTVLALTQQGRIGVGTAQPEQTLDVAGVMRSHGREGTQQGQQAGVPADGHWHTISPRLEGCQALEVVAGVGIRRSGRYALIRAVAMNTCAPDGFFFNFLKRKNRIKAQHAYYRSSADKLKLRWVRDLNDPNQSDTYRPYYLQIRSNTRYDAGTVIRYHITRLWHDDYMQHSAAPSERQTGGS
ncbi:hypothetical protein [Oceanospirillum sediminis]|uniref:Uncharacterized protein n=1 Tax=Oceanospirillum sediminis TaxID=2760088 RepID=A0A839IQD0_9GAMM|nr:hypothetical protein [Oceanospirillum sediminis]MBB1487168.1 hypothetical protein [Oceanospirillum sediminis]